MMRQKVEKGERRPKKNSRQTERRRSRGLL